MSAPKVFQFKLVLLGDSAVGKSSLVLRFVRGQFFEYQESTIGGAMPPTSGRCGGALVCPRGSSGAANDLSRRSTELGRADQSGQRAGGGGRGRGDACSRPPRSPSRPTACLRRSRCAAALTTRWACAARSCILDSDSGVERHDRQVRYDIPAPPAPSAAPLSRQPARRACDWRGRGTLAAAQPAPSSAVADRSPHPRCCT